MPVKKKEKRKVDGTSICKINLFIRIVFVRAAAIISYSIQI